MPQDFLGIYSKKKKIKKYSSFFLVHVMEKKRKDLRDDFSKCEEEKDRRKYKREDWV